MSTATNFVRIDQNIRASIVAEYQAGTPVADIASKYSVSLTSVKNFAREAGVPLRIESQPAEQRQQMAAEYADGTSIYALAKKYDLAYDTVRRNIQREGVALRKRLKAGVPSKLSEMQKYLIVSGYRNGASTTALGERFGVTPVTIARVVRDAGVPIRSTRGIPQKFTDEQRAVLAEEYNAGASLAVLAEKYATTQQTVSKHLKAAGVVLRSRKKSVSSDITVDATQPTGQEFADVTV